jgi:Na+-driven multidrug efflux pump
MFELVLTALIGSVDTIMVTNIGLAAMATEGAIICAQYLESNQKDKANQALKQLIFSVTLISILITLPCILFRRPLLSLIFGSEKKRDGQFVKLSFHNSPILSLYRSI